MTRYDELDTYFEAAKAQPPQPSDAFMDNLSAAVQAEAQDLLFPRQPQTEIPISAASPWTVLKTLVGGVPGLAGLTGAAALGLIIGVSPNLAPSVTSDWFTSNDAWLVDTPPALDSQLELALSESS